MIAGIDSLMAWARARNYPKWTIKLEGEKYKHPLASYDGSDNNLAMALLEEELGRLEAGKYLVEVFIGGAGDAARRAAMPLRLERTAVVGATIGNPGLTFDKMEEMISARLKEAETRWNAEQERIRDKEEIKRLQAEKNQLVKDLDAVSGLERVLNRTLPVLEPYLPGLAEKIFKNKEQPQIGRPDRPRNPKPVDGAAEAERAEAAMDRLLQRDPRAVELLEKLANMTDETYESIQSI
jgi:hypothetical protein